MAQSWDDAEGFECSRCGTDVGAQDSFCPGCGNELDPPDLRCPGCNAGVASVDTYCRSCGKDLTGHTFSATYRTAEEDPTASDLTEPEVGDVGPGERPASRGLGAGMYRMIAMLIAALLIFSLLSRGQS